MSDPALVASEAHLQPRQTAAQRSLRLAFAVHGRFHCFDLARELIRQGHGVMVMTNYPAFVGARFGLPAQTMSTFVAHGVLARGLEALCGPALREQRDALLHPMFGRWAAIRVFQHNFDAVHCFSGVAEEVFHMPRHVKTLRTLVRGSAHIATQHALLDEEEARLGYPIEKPTRWMIEREVREYALADMIFVLSSFARTTFIERGVPEQRLRLLPLGTELRAFLAREDQLAARIQRIRSGAPLRVLYVGAFSAQKGAVDFASVAERLAGKFEFKAVGPVTADGRRIANRISAFVAFPGKMPHYQLPEAYEWGDVFLFPTIQDGYAAVLAQAQAAGLPIIGTSNCGAPDMVRQGVSGWIVPIRSPEAIVEHLDWCNGHREQLAEMVGNLRGAHAKRDWSDVARDYAAIIQKGI